jgi:hypothetical protein
MKMTVEIEMDNAAFEDNQGGEAARILRAVASDVQDSPTLSGTVGGVLRDANGNAVGKWDIWE